MDFGDRLRWLIEENDLTQKQLASMLEIPPTTLNNYVIRQSEPDFAMLKRIAIHFDVSTDYLLDHHSQETNESEERMLRAFRKLPNEQQRVILEQTKAVAKLYTKE